MLISYIHGFLSGSQAVKANILRAEIAAHYPDCAFIAPDFPDTPEEAYEALTEFAESHLNEDLCLVGSSMGGFLSTLLSIKFNLKACLINPCIHPQDYFEKLIGPQYNPLTDTHFELKPQMLDYLLIKDRECAKFDPKLIRVFLQDGDEVLDYRKSLEFFAAAHPAVQPGGCHAFENFGATVPEIMSFFGAQRR